MVDDPNAPGRDVSPFADPSLPRATRYVLMVLCLAMIGALGWALWLLWANTTHPLAWGSLVVWGGYCVWMVWSRRRDAARH